jgi:NTP pyrophosphatase (non-canonical NTP hydrolase)
MEKTDCCPVCGETDDLEKAFCFFKDCGASEMYEEQKADMKEIAEYQEFDAYQDFTDETAIYPEEKGLEYTALGLASEAGEYAGKVKKIIRDGNEVDVDALAKELGDVMWYVARCAAELDVYLSDVAKTNVDKLKSRKERDVIGGSGDDR